jgi:hypothetical protein
VKAPTPEKGIQNRDAPASTEGAELYNLDKDIGESNNLAASEPDKVKELAAAWDKWNAELVPPKWKQGNAGKKGGGAGGGAKKRKAQAQPQPQAQ